MSSEKPLHGEELALFAPLSYNAAFDKFQWVDYCPFSQIRDQAPLEFLIPSSGAQYINLKKTYLSLKLRLLKADGTPIVPSDSDTLTYSELEVVTPINSPFDTMWSQVDVYLQQKLVSNSGTNYAYKAMIETLLDFGYDAKESQLQCRGYYKDISSAMDSTDAIRGANRGLTKRYGLFKDGQIVELIGNLRSDICQQDRFLLNGVEVKIVLWPAKSPFSLMTSQSEPDYKITVVDAVLKVYKATLKPELNVSHTETLSKVPVSYVYDKTQIKVFSVLSGQYSFRYDDIFTGDVPEFLVIGMVKSKAYTGDYTLNPFNFVHKKLSSLAVYINDESLPARPIRPNFTVGNYMEAFHNLFTALGIDGKDAGLHINHEDFAAGYALFVFNLKPDQLPAVSRRGNLRIEGTFASAVDENLTLITYGRFPFLLQIDEARNVIM